MMDILLRIAQALEQIAQALTHQTDFSREDAAVRRTAADVAQAQGRLPHDTQP